MTTSFTDDTFRQACRPAGVDNIKSVSAVNRYAICFQASVLCALDESLPVTLALFFQDRVPAQFISLPDDRLRGLEGALRNSLFNQILDVR